MGCLSNPRARSKVHLSSFECEPISYSKKAATSAPSKEHIEAVKSEVTKFKQAGGYKRDILPLVVGEYRGSEKEDRKMAGVCGLYRSQQGLS